MSTEAQINANRQNAQKSTGPQSPEGKAAVSQNAVKHGLFASGEVIEGENREDFEAFRDEMLGELAPASPVETMLCDRIVNLSWRLKRIEDMQDQAIEVMMARDEPSPLTKHARASLPKFLRDLHDDPRGAGPELVLGRAVIKDYSNSRVLDRLSLYERRIEHSLFKTMDELRNLRLARQLQQAETAEAESTAATGSPQSSEANFAKQSQFEPAQTRASVCTAKDYEGESALGGSKNKPKQSQFARGQSKEPWRPHRKTATGKDDAESIGVLSPSARGSRCCGI